MIIHVKYFGVVAEKTGRKEEEIEFKRAVNLSEFSDFIKDKYQLDQIPFKVAINQNIDDDSASLQNSDEVAILPPFAGG